MDTIPTGRDNIGMPRMMSILPESPYSVVAFATEGVDGRPTATIDDRRYVIAHGRNYHRTMSRRERPVITSIGAGLSNGIVLVDVPGAWTGEGQYVVKRLSSSSIFSDLSRGVPQVKPGRRFVQCKRDDGQEISRANIRQNQL